MVVGAGVSAPSPTGAWRRAARRRGGAAARASAAARTASTSQVFSDCRTAAAASSARCFSASGMRSVMRAVRASSSPSSGAVRRAAAGRRRLGGRDVVGDDEVRIAAPQADLDAGAVEGGGDLGGGVGQRLQEGHPHRRVEGVRQPIGGVDHRLAARRRGGDAGRHGGARRSP